MQKLWKLIAISVVLTGITSAQAQMPKSLEKGKKLFAENCLTCHGEKGAGDGPAGQYLNPKPRHLGTDTYKNGDTKEKIFETLTNGLKGTTMASYAHLKEPDRRALADYVVYLRKEAKGSAAAAPAKK